MQNLKIEVGLTDTYRVEYRVSVLMTVQADESFFQVPVSSRGDTLKDALANFDHEMARLIRAYKSGDFHTCYQKVILSFGEASPVEKKL